MIQQSKTDGPRDTEDYWAKCNGCGIHMNQPDIAYTNNEGDEYCTNCNEAIQDDDESSGRIKQED